MSGKTNRKHRRNKTDCERYKIAGRRETNKAIKQERHRKLHPDDKPVSSGTISYTRRKPLTALERMFSRK